MNLAVVTEATSSPCVGCAARPSCREPCAALDAMIGPSEIRSFKEFGSVALMNGNASYAVTLPAVFEDETNDDVWPNLVTAYRPRLRKALGHLPDAELEILAARVVGQSRADLATKHGLAIKDVDVLALAALNKMRLELGPLPDRAALLALPANDNDNDNKVSGMEEPMAMKADRSSATRLELGQPDSGVPCAERGCPNLVSGHAPKSPELAPYCRVHRAQRAALAAQQSNKSSSRTPRVLQAAPDAPSDHERALVAALVRRMAANTPEIVDVTPALARALLERNTQNRRIEDRRVEVYAKDMATSEWRVNNQGIALGADGTLYDGQHRLLAVIRANRAVPMLVIAGLASEARTTIDQGRVRSIGDNLRILDGEAQGTRIVSWFNAIERLVTRHSVSMSHAFVRRQLAMYDASVRWFLAHGPRSRPYYRAPLVGALVYAHRVAGPEVEHFTVRYVTGAELPAGSPVLALRDHIAERGHLIGTDRARATCLKTLRCLLADLRGETLDRVVANEDGFEHFRKLYEKLDENSARESHRRAA